MIKFYCVSFLLAFATCAPRSGDEYTLALECSEEVCKLPDCRCASTNIPGGLAREETPQFVLFTFDDAVTPSYFEYYKKAFFDKVNPDGCQIGSTYYVSHDWITPTDYSKVHELHAHGQEIALHSITHQLPATYWLEASKAELTDEFGTERDIIAHFADIPADSFRGMRLPFLQLSGNESFEVLQNLGLDYDSSWPTDRYIDNGLWPYSLNYKSTQDCPIGPCPDASIPDVWEMPMIDWVDLKNVKCSMVDSCVNIPTDVDELVDLFIMNFNKQYKGTRAPWGFYVHPPWFDEDETRFTAYLKFIDYLQTLNDVYIVNVARVIDWIKDPVSIKDGPLHAPCQTTYRPRCTPKTCQLTKVDDNEERLMTSCVSDCPDVYPWLGNAYGNSV